MPDSPSANDPGPTDGSTTGIRRDPYLGRVLDGRYAVRELLSVTAMSRVYKVTQLRSGHQYALKILAHASDTPDAPEQVTARERFVREAKTLAGLSHPHIISLADYGVVDDRPYMVMQYLEGLTLHQLLRTRSPSLHQTFRLAEQLCDALSAAHARGVVHRDIKPSNLFLLGPHSPEPHLLLFDFGIAKGVDDTADLTGVDAVVGTVWYMAPEQAMGDPIDARTDIYAMGALLYRLITGRTPFGHHRGVSVLVAHIGEDPPAFHTLDHPPDVPPVVEWTLARCLEKKPADRFRDVRELRKALAVCRLALEDPHLDTTLELQDGRVYANENVAELLHGTELLTKQVPPIRSVERAERTLVWVGAVFLVLGLACAVVLAALLLTGPAT